MPKRLSNSRARSEDAAQSGFRTVQRLIAITEGAPEPRKPNVVSIAERRRKNPAAVALGRKGGKQSAIARMKKIAPEERRRIASEAARARWAKEKGGA